MVAKLEQVVVKLKKEVSQITEIVERFDKEVNRQYKLLQDVKAYCLKTNMTIEEYEKLAEMIGE